MDADGRQLLFLPLARLEDCPEHLNLPSPNFGLLLACDVRPIPDHVILNVAKSLLQNGLAFFCGWGPDCERVHDLFDDAICEREPNPTDSSVIMTTWHDEENLDEALWFHLNTAFAAGDYEASCKASLIISVGNDHWTQKIEKRLAAPEQLSAEILGPET